MSTKGVVSPTRLGVGASRPSALRASSTVTSSASGCAAEAARSISAARVWLRSSDCMDRMLDEVCDARGAFVNKCSSAHIGLDRDFVTTSALAWPYVASGRKPGGCCCPRGGPTHS